MFICIVPPKACQDPKIKFLIKTLTNIKVSFGILRILGSCTTKIITKMSKETSAVTKMLDIFKEFSKHAVYRFNEHAI